MPLPCSFSWEYPTPETNRSSQPQVDAIYLTGEVPWCQPVIDIRSESKVFELEWQLRGSIKYQLPKPETNRVAPEKEAKAPKAM